MHPLEAVRAHYENVREKYESIDGEKEPLLKNAYRLMMVDLEKTLKKQTVHVSEHVCTSCEG